MLQNILLDLRIGCSILELGHIHIFQRELNPNLFRVDLSLGKQDHRLVGSRHGEHVHEHVPEHWGIITAEESDGSVDFYFLRQPQCNPGRKWRWKLSLLWRPELAQLQEWNDMPKYKDKSKLFVIRKIMERIPEKLSEETLSQQVSEILFERDYMKVAELLAEYRKGELQKKIEQEEDPEKRRELLERQAKMQKNFVGKARPRPGRRRRSRKRQVL